MRKTNTIGPFRIEDADRELIDEAVRIEGVKLAEKVRELALAWAKKTIRKGK